jgi:TolB protein
MPQAPSGLAWCMVRIVALVAALLAATALPAAAEGDTFGVSSAGHIAFVLPDGQVAMVDPVTTVVTPLGPPEHVGAFPTWAPDGERVAYLALAGLDALAAIVRARADEAPEVVYSSREDAPIYLSWSPDGALLALLVADLGGTELHLVDTATGEARPFARGTPLYWAWSPSSDRVLIHLDVLQPTAVAGFSAVEAFAVPHPLPEPGVFQTPAISPSERFVAYATRTASDVRRVVLLSTPYAEGVDGAELRADVRRPGDDDPEPLVRRELPHMGQASLAWHPQRDLLAIQRSEPRGFGSLSLLDADTGELEVVVPGRSLAFFWSPDGRSIAYLTLQLGAPAGASEQHVGLLFELEPLLPLLGLHVLDVETRTSRELAAFVPTRLFVEQILPFFDQFARSHPVWSPGSDALVFSAVDETGRSMLTLFALDGTIRHLSEGEMPAWNVR